MSSRKAATAKAAKNARTFKSARTIKPAAAAGSAGASADALQLAAAVERKLAAGEHDALSPDAVQALAAVVCKIYSMQVEAGDQTLPLKPNSVAPTEVMVTASGLLRSANLAVFELGMWQSWTGR
jgi:hypothetical protein